MLSLFYLYERFCGNLYPIPFAHAMPLCNFATGGYESELARRYNAAVREEIERPMFQINPQCGVWTRIYFGGGTPRP